MKPTYRRLLIFAVSVVVVLLGYFGYRFYAASQRGIPPEFTAARSKMSAVSAEIIVNSNDIATSVARLGSPTSTPAEASSTLGHVLDKVDEVHDQAVELSAALETMTRDVQNIHIAEAQQMALQAISQRLAFVSRLVNYTDYVNRLAVAIRLHLESGAQNSDMIKQLIRQVNSEVTAANSLSTQADESMAKFDSLLH